MRALVTGAFGFVARHLIPRLVEEGYEVTGVDTALRIPLNLEQMQDHSKLRLVKCYDCVDYINALDEKEFDLVIHLAAFIQNVDARMRAGIDAYSDIETDLQVCKWVEAYRPKTLVLLSSCAVDFPKDPYCIVKRNLEIFALNLASHGQDVKVLRPFSGYGYDQSDDYPFPSIMKRAHAREHPLKVWGGPQERDWLHIDDFTKGIIFSIKNFPSGIPVELGTARAVNFYELARLIAAEVSAKTLTKNDGYRPTVEGDMSKAASSSRRVAGQSGYPMAQAFGWKPVVSLRDGIHIEYEKFLQSL